MDADQIHRLKKEVKFFVSNAPETARPRSYRPTDTAMEASTRPDYTVWRDAMATAENANSAVTPEPSTLSLTFFATLFAKQRAR